LNALIGLRVLDLSETVAGAYCAKLFTDAGAEVIKVEPPSGHPLRRWSASGSVGTDDDVDGVLFRYLAADQKSVVADMADPQGPARVRELAAGSDIVISTSTSGLLEERGLSLADLSVANPAIVMIAITPFGLSGPRCGEDRPDFLLQALSGSLHNHGSPGRSPLAVGGRLGEWVAGPYAAAGGLAAHARAVWTGRAEMVDVSTLESLAITLVCYPSVAASMPGGVRRRATYTLIPGIEPCKDGFVGLTTLTVQQWLDFLAMIDRQDLMDDESLYDQRHRIARQSEIQDVIHAWTLERTADEIVERAALFRVPAAPVLNGQTVLQLGHLKDRGLFANNPQGDLPHPKPPFRTTATDAGKIRDSPRLGEHDRDLVHRRPAAKAARCQANEATLPFGDIRVLDVTAFWAGPCATAYLAALGADVIKVESVQRPDSMRFNVTVPPTTDRWYEQGYLYLSANLNKRGITLNLGDPRGRRLFMRLVERSDVVVENFTPRVVEQFGVDYEALRTVRQDLIMVRMPGWGLSGPWQDRPGFATTMEQAAGMAWVTGYRDGPPMAPGLCDPFAAIHATFAVLAALEQRKATGEGQQIELSMIDLAVSASAEQLLEYSAYGHLMTREGNRERTAAPQGVYRCAGKDEWMALSISRDPDWEALGKALGQPAWSADPSLSCAAGRAAAHDVIDARLDEWFAERSLDVALGELRHAGVPAEPVTRAYDIDQDPQMQARGFWQAITHPVVGTHRYPGLPFRLSGGPDGWYRSPAPLLGQHNEEVLVEELGLSSDEFRELQAASVIGNRPLGL
jgi:crotonobetainyl-CoA:carnitine CoA-transferase CaiB-like acyl-CoA transferase